MINTGRVAKETNMSGIGIIGAGIAGLQLALFLQQHDVPVTLYADRSADAILASRLPSTVGRFGRTRARERAWREPLGRA
jgi:glycine/D-amino acid oxidase-like deaminating enzyme